MIQGGYKLAKIVEDILRLKKKGTVLDLGVGEGRNAIFLAKQGFNVIGVDISKKAIEKFQRLAEEFGVNIRAIVGDITLFQFDTKYDVILSLYTLHFIR